MIDGTTYNMDWLTTCDINIMLENKGFDKLDDYTPSEAQLQLPREKSSLMLRDTEVEEIDLESAWLNHFGSVYFVDRPDDYNDIYAPHDWDEMMLKVGILRHSNINFNFLLTLKQVANFVGPLS